MTSNSLKCSPRALPALSSPTSNSPNPKKSVPKIPAPNVPKVPNLNKCKFQAKSNNNKYKNKSLPNNTNNNSNNIPAPAPPELAPLKSPSPSSSDRFKGIKLPTGWLQCALEFIQPLRDYRILVCKTPIDKEIAQYLKIPKEKYFLPHTIYTLPNKHFIQKQQQQNLSVTQKRKVGLVIDLTNQMYYDQISFNNGKKTNKVKRRIITMQNLCQPTESETSGFVGLVKSYLDGTNNMDKWIVIHDDLGFNLAGFMCCAFMVKELNYSVDAAVYQFCNSKRPGIYDVKLIRLLHEMYSDKEDLETFEQMLKIKPLQKPYWLTSQTKNKFKIKSKSKPKSVQISNNNSEFAVPTKSIRRKRSFSEMNVNNNNKNNNNVSTSTSNSNQESLLCEPKLMSESEPHKSQTNIIMEPVLLEPMEPPLKKQRMNNNNSNNNEKVQVHMPRELKQDHSYLIAVGDQHLQHLTTIALQLSKTKELFHSICNKPATIPRSSLMALSTNYRISWLGAGYSFWLMILGSKGCFFVDPSYFESGKLGGIYHISGTRFYDDNSRKYMDGTLCCGELVIDNIVVNKQTREMKKVPRFLITDMLVLDKQSLSKFPHTERLMRAENYLYKPFAKSLHESKLRIRVKPMYAIENKDIVNKLQKMIQNELPHKCDGLGLFPIKQPFGQRILRIAL